MGMKKFIPIFFIFISVFSHASLVEVSSKLEKNAKELDGNLLSKNPVLSKYLEQAKIARDVVCKSNENYRMLDAKNIWAEVQAIAKIQKLTIQKYIETCSQMTPGNRTFCDKDSRDGKASDGVAELSRLYGEIQGCATNRVDERVSFIAEKLRKKKILSCTKGNPYSSETIIELLGEEVYFVNPKYLSLSYEEVASFAELDVANCKLGNKEYDLRKILVYSAINVCMADNTDYEKCLFEKCPSAEASCRTQYRNTCFEKALVVARDFGRENINKCLTQELIKPSDSNVQETKAACLKDGSLSVFHRRIEEVGFSVSRSNKCYRGEKCKQALEAAFSELTEGKEFCENSQFAKTKSGSSSYGAGSK